MTPSQATPKPKEVTALEKRQEFVGMIPTIDYVEAKEIFKKIVAPGASDSHAALVFHYAKQLGLDPLQKQVMLLKGRALNAETQKWEDSYSVIVGVHGIIGTCARQPDFHGIMGAAVYANEDCTIDADQKVHHVQTPSKRTGLPIGAWATVQRVRHGQIVRTTVYVPFDECKQVNESKGGSLRGPWMKMPGTMNLKVAKCQAARQAYADQLGQVYGAEEMGGYTTDDGQVVLEADQEWKAPKGKTAVKPVAAAEVVAPGSPAPEPSTGFVPPATDEPVPITGPEAEPYEESEAETPMHCEKCTWPILCVVKKKDGQWVKVLICKMAKSTLETFKDEMDPEKRKNLIEGHYLSQEILDPALEGAR